MPAYPVYIVLDTQKEFVGFIPTASNSHIIVNKSGIYENGKFVRLPDATWRWGCGGVVTYIAWGQYYAFDLCCPNCASLRIACEMNGLFAECPRCGEQYDLSTGVANPRNGIARESLRKLPMSVISYSDNAKVITIKQ